MTSSTLYIIQALGIVLLNDMRIPDPFMGHKMHTEGGSSGSPVLREYKREWKVVGVHRGDVKVDGEIKVNIATMAVAIIKFLSGNLDCDPTALDLKAFVAEISGPTEIGNPDPSKPAVKKESRVKDYPKYQAKVMKYFEDMADWWRVMVNLGIQRKKCDTTPKNKLYGSFRFLD